MGCFSPLKGFKDTETNGITFKRSSKAYATMEVACGQCLGCRLDRSLSWAMRIVHESTLHDDHHGNCFITLTYREKYECTPQQLAKGHYLPEPPTLIKSHYQKFMKRLRRHFPQKIRYFHCGEYGDISRRPHYHACLFNVSFPDQALWKNDDGLYTYYSPTLEKLWPYGFSTIGELNFETAAYTARYCLKKVTGHNAEEHYKYLDPDTGELTSLLAEYITMSLKPGIGSDFFKKYKTDFLDDRVPVPGKGVLNKLPRAYEKLLESSDPEQLAKIKEQRKEYFNDHKKDFTPQALHSKYKCVKARQSLRSKTL